MESEQNILSRIAAGEESAIEDCLSTYGGLVWTLAKRFCKLDSDAEDATQEIFIAIWKNAAKYDSGISSEATFISMIARRRLIDRLRKSSRALDTVSIESDFNSPSKLTKDQLEIDDEVARTQKYMEQLKPEEKQVIELSVCQHLPQTKIAEQLQLPLGTVKTHARRGMMRLRELLGIGTIQGGVSG